MRRRQVTDATAPLCSAPPGSRAGPTRRFAAMVLAARTRPDGRAGQQRPRRRKGLSRAQRSSSPKATRETTGLDDEHESGKADGGDCGSSLEMNGD